MLSYGKVLSKETIKQQTLAELYTNKERILNQMTKAKSERTKKKIIEWIECIDTMIRSEYGEDNR